MSTTNDWLSDRFADFEEEYQQGYERAKYLGQNIQFHTYDSVAQLIEDIEAKITQLVNEARLDQTFRVIQSLVKAGSISDTAAANTLALFSAELKPKKEQP